MSMNKTPELFTEHVADHSVSAASSTSVETVYEVDSDYSGVAQTQPCYKNGIHYTPLGLKKTYQKKRKLNFDSPTKSS